VDEVIPSLVRENINAILTVVPYHEKIKNAIFSMNEDVEPGPDGFGAFFFQTYWKIM